VRLNRKLATLAIAASTLSLSLPAQPAIAAPIARQAAKSAPIPIALEKPQYMRVTLGWGVYVNGYGWEWRVLAAAVASVGAGAIAAGCVFSRVPGAIGQALRYVCATIGATRMQWLLRQVVRAYRQGRFSRGRCYNINALRIGSGMRRVKARGNCYRA